MVYVANYGPAVSLDAGWNSPEWAGAQVAQISNFRPESKGASWPTASARLKASPAGLHGIFSVAGELVRCRRTRYFDEVWKDSCVEFFVEPFPGRGYFNFEFNCGGAFLCNYITDPTRLPGGGLTKAQRMPEAVGRQIAVVTSLPGVTDPESASPRDWTLAFSIPYAVFEPFLGEIKATPGASWRCNFFKCAEEVSNPHWASWCPVDEFNFHLPRCFGDLVFSPA